MTPEQAQEAGVDYMVIGRPVTQSADPAATLRAINDSLRKGHNERFQQPSGLLHRNRAYRRGETGAGAPKGDGIVRIQRQTSGRKGKGVCLISGIDADDAALTALAAELKKMRLRRRGERWRDRDPGR